MDGCGAGAVSKAGAARRQPKAAAAAARCRCPQKRKKMGTGVLLDVPLDFIPGSYQVLLYFALAPPRLASCHGSPFTRAQPADTGEGEQAINGRRQGTERRRHVACELDETDDGRFVA